jgi:hypothetical protein
VQDVDTLSNNFGDVAAHPELIDLNFPPNSSSSDWVHANSIDYNPELDQIMINSRDFEEFWIIDHSTTTSEAASHVGGTYGHGGDILYRWGNPQSYKRGDVVDKIFSLQHDAHWIPEGMPGEGMIMVFNNGVQRPEGLYSSVDIVMPDINHDGTYNLNNEEPYGPDTLFQTIDGGDTSSFYSPRLAGAQRMPNGNTLICVGAPGRILEFDAVGKTVWHYQNPVGVNGPVEQGFIPPSRDMFRAYRYTPDFAGFIGRDLTPGDPIELEPLPSTCTIWQDSITSVEMPSLTEDEWIIYPNPARTDIIIQSGVFSDCFYELFDILGNRVEAGHAAVGQSISCHQLPSGNYFLRIFDPRNQRHGIKKVIIQ